MAIFGKKTPAPPPAAAPAAAAPGFEFSPEKAKRFFDHARTVHEATNFEYAMTSWLSGLRHDPSNTDALEGFFKSAAAYREGGLKKSPSREMARAFAGGKTPVDRYLGALLQWGCSAHDANAAVSATAAAAGLGLAEPTAWLGRAALNLSRDKSARKGSFMQLMEIFEKFSNFELALQAGQAASLLDPADTKLSAALRNMSAQATMTKGGFDQVGQEGGFRAGIRDADKQRRLDEESRVVKTGETLDRLLEAAKADYEARPSDKPAVRKYVDRLLERGMPEDEETAYEVLTRAHAETHEFAFRQAAGAIRLRQAKREVRELAAAAKQEAGEGNGQAASGPAHEAYEKARQEHLALEMAELALRVENYPTDLGLKFELGRRSFDLGRYDEAIALFQEAKAEIKNRIKVMNYLGQSFYKIEFHDGAIETFREALDAVGAGDPEMTMELKYGLMLALEGRAKENGDAADAEDAYKLASQIAIQQFSYRDVKLRREELKALVGKLKGTG